MAASLAPVRVSAILLISLLVLLAEAVTLPSGYDTIWTTQSTNSSGSMPVGGGSIGLNTWAENGRPYLRFQASMQEYLHRVLQATFYFT